ncbi:MAG: protein-glutamate O-methyltransferase CheR [Halococcoides sp.]
MSRRSGSQEGFQRLLETLENRLDFESGFYNDAYLDRRITARIRRTDVDEYDAYRRMLESDPEERDALLDSLSINVTGFFRNPEVWDRLRPILAELTDERRTVRIWSAPCADGREPYSVAMLARDTAAIDERRIDILGTDINADVLDRARRATYETSTTSDIESELEPLSDPTAFVERDGSTFTVSEEVRSMVSFERHDLVSGSAPGSFDLILCRNLLIYIDSAYKEPIFETILDGLDAGDYLVIGMTETVPVSLRNRFDPVDKRRRIYRLTG